LAGLDGEVEASEDGLFGTSRVPEVDVAEFDGAFDGGYGLTVVGPEVDGGFTIEEYFEFLGCLFGFTHVRWRILVCNQDRGREERTCKGEDRSGGLGTEDHGGEADEELEEIVLAVCDLVSPVPIESQ
jgi:hypothetical protein